ncbi:MAG: outer membrane protein assembly factor BamD [Pseudazoarcus pumilus]|nr:outer membrane protein assembly factor BamD [Pseudazoarcus pumilus]
MKVLRSLAVISAALAAGCGLLPEQIDETVGWSAQRIHAEARAAMTEGGYDRAIELLEKLEARYPFGRFAQQAQIEIAYAYYKTGEREMALAAADRFIRLHPNHPSVDYAFYLKGLVNFNENLGLLGFISNQDLSERDPKGAQEAFDTFNELITRFPDSRYTPDAIQRMRYLVNSLALHEVHVARYYHRRGAYVAAVNRAQAAIKNYPDTPAIEEALFIMMRSYDAMGLTELRDDTARVIKLSFPDSVYYRGGPEENRAWWQLW